MTMLTAKRLTALVVLAVFLVPFVPRPAAADDSDIFGQNVQPNVLIIIDDSGSMADSVPSNGYQPLDTYTVQTTNYCDKKTTTTTTGTGKNKKTVTTTTYQPCNTTYVYKSTGTNLYATYATAISSVNSSTAQAALNSTGYWTGSISGSTVNLFVGNYVNYLYDTCAQGGVCNAPKIDIAKRVVNTLVSTTEGIRFGLMTFQYVNGWQGVGGKVLAEVGSSVATITAAVNTLAPTGDTPLGDTLYDAGQYYKGATLLNGTRFTSPVTLACQPNFVIFVTDGMQTSGTRYMTPPTVPMGGPVAPLSNNPDNHVASDLFQTDMFTSTSMPGKQNIILHTVGFGESAGGTPPAEVTEGLRSLQAAARDGGGQFYQADTESQLEAALQDAVRRIAQATFTFATPVIPTTSTTGSSRAYLAAFKSDASSPFWRGYLKAYQRGTNGLVPVDNNGVPCGPDDQGNLGPGCSTSALVWEAGKVLSQNSDGSTGGILAANRTIYTVVPPITASSALSSFDTSNTGLTASVLNVADQPTANNVINFVRGIDAFDANGNGNTTEERDWKLGDIFHSTPVLVTPPVLGLRDVAGCPNTNLTCGYATFKSSQSNRTTILIAGANDGMLHAFRESDGRELWAFVPPDLLDNLHSLTALSGDHQYFVDASPIAVDVRVSGTWKTIVIFGLRRGGHVLYALDITDTLNPAFLWAYPGPQNSPADSRIGETWSEPAIGRVRLGGVDKFVAFFGGGYDTASNNSLGKEFVALDLATGARLFRYYNDNLTMDDRQFMNFSLAANATAVDLDGDGYIDHVYIGDVGGQIWKFDVHDQTSSSNWTAKRLFVADSVQSTTPPAGEYYPTQGFYGAPALALDSNGKAWLFIGSGDRNHPNSPASNWFYGIKDVGTTDMSQNSPIQASSLADVSSSGTANSSGWRLAMASTEKVLASANVFNMIVFFSSFTPTSTVTCTSGGGTAKLYAVQVTTGFGAVNFNTGAALSMTDATTTRSQTIGQGIASMPVIVITPPASGGGAIVSTSVVTATSNQQLPANPAPAPSSLKQIRSWAEAIQ